MPSPFTTTAAPATIATWNTKLLQGLEASIEARLDAGEIDDRKAFTRYLLDVGAELAGRGL